MKPLFILILAVFTLLISGRLSPAQDSSGLTTGSLGAPMPQRTPPPPITDPRNPFYRPPPGALANATPTSATPAVDYPWSLNLPSNKDHAFLSYDAVYKSAGAATTYEWQTDYGSSISNRKTASGVEITVANSGQGGGAVRVRWFFYADSSGKQLVGKGERDIILWKNQKESWVVNNSQTQHDEHYVALSESYSSGARVGGWLVQFMSAPGKVVKQIGSSSTLESKNP